jgi:signal peptidase I
MTAGLPRSWQVAIDWVVTIAAAIGLVIAIKAWVVNPYKIPSASMEPTLHGCTGCHNDRVLVDKLSYRTHDVHRGDVIVFHRPAAWQVADKVLIKRVIGLPGEELTTRRGVVYINGLAVDEPYLNTACRGGTKDLPKTLVPDGEYFVLGDNRCDSADSRTFGPVPQSSVIGRAFMIIWPFGRVHWL